MKKKSAPNWMCSNLTSDVPIQEWVERYIKLSDGERQQVISELRRLAEVLYTLGMSARMVAAGFEEVTKQASRIDSRKENK